MAAGERTLVLAEGFSGDAHYGKTLRGVLRYRPEDVVVILDSARAVALGGKANRVGYVLDGFGGLHPFNGARSVTGGPSWPVSQLSVVKAMSPSSL